MNFFVRGAYSRLRSRCLICMQGFYSADILYLSAIVEVYKNKIHLVNGVVRLREIYKVLDPNIYLGVSIQGSVC